MTSVCVAGGASQPKAGVGVLVTMTAAALSQRFAVSASWISTLIAAAIWGTAYEVGEFCTHDPPAEPTLTAQDFLDAIQTVLWPEKLAAQQKIRDWIGAHVWYDLCECVTGTQPTAPGYQSDPGDLPQVDPPAVTPVVPIGACQTITATTFGPPWSVGSPPIILDAPIDIAATSYRLTLTVTPGAGTHATSATPSLQFGVNPGVSFIRTDSFGSIPVTPFVAERTTPAGANYVRLNWFPNPDNSSDVGHATLELFCGNFPGDGLHPCCPPDPILQGQISQILDIVTLIQRQSVPFGYVASTVHTGLSGAGALSISGVLGVKVGVTTLPSSYGVAGTSPPEHFDLGFVTFGCADGFPSAFRLTRNPQVMMPARAGLYTDLDYDLSPGVVVDITELVREP